MKKKLTACLSALFLLCGCASAQVNDPEAESGKTILKLGHWLREPLAAKPVHESVSIEVNDLEETERQPYEKDLIPDVVTERVALAYPDTDFENWSVMIHFYNDEKSAGQISLRYEIGDEISTDKAIVCSIENGSVTDLWYANMDGNADEADLLAGLRKFKETTEQETYELKEGETLLEEKTSYTYRYETDHLIYTYNIFVEEPSGVINNDIGCEYVIEQGG